MTMPGPINLSTGISPILHFPLAKWAGASVGRDPMASTFSKIGKLFLELPWFVNLWLAHMFKTMNFRDTSLLYKRQHWPSERYLLFFQYLFSQKTTYNRAVTTGGARFFYFIISFCNLWFREWETNFWIYVSKASSGLYSSILRFVVPWIRNFLLLSFHLWTFFWSVLCD